jgi:hypothetical protein
LQPAWAQKAVPTLSGFQPEKSNEYKLITLRFMQFYSCKSVIILYIIILTAHPGDLLGGQIGVMK